MLRGIIKLVRSFKINLKGMCAVKKGLNFKHRGITIKLRVVLFILKAIPMKEKGFKNKAKPM
jgi:hypothetical protein